MDKKKKKPKKKQKKVKMEKKRIDTPKGIRDPKWDRTDEAGWESFPASDPPGNY